MLFGGSAFPGARGRGRWALRAATALAWVALASIGGCNAISGVGDLDFSAGGQASGAAGPATGTSSASASSAAGGAGSGGESCGPCDEPQPGDAACWAMPGTCTAGVCVYAPLEDAPCNDGNACTTLDLCDGRGECVGLEPCPAPNDCQTSTCVDGACQDAPVTDGTSCGNAAPADVCCGGTCVNISSDPAHCGGCGLACHVDEGCQSVEVTDGCEVHPANTSGRCTCPGENAKCPGELICRTVTPYNNLCSPDPGGCPPGATFLEVNLCPNYCFY